MKKFLTASFLGAALAWFLDPKAGSGRRDSLRDKLTRVKGKGATVVPPPVKDVAKTVQSTAKSAANTARSASGTVAEKVPHPRDNPNPDDNTLRDRVESEVFRDPSIPKGDLNINVVEGIVELRGELDSKDAISNLVNQVKSVPDVKGVHNYLHLPGTPAPNKESALEV